VTAVPATAVAATATADVTPLDDTATFISSVLEQRHTLPTAKLSNSELANVIALARQSVAAEQSHLSNAAVTVVRTSSSVTADTTTTGNTVIVNTSGDTELVATSESGESTSRGSPLAVLSLSESVAAVQATHSARSSSNCASQTLRRPTRRTN
jgi:hypothetical protein